MKNGLSIQKITAGYNDAPILNEISLDVKKRDTTVVMGPSGCGKTTLLLTILGIHKPSHGHIQLDGVDITDVPIEERNIGYVPQDYGLFPHLDVLGNVAYGLRVRGIEKEKQQRIAQDMLQLVQMENFEKKKIDTLSGGQRQRISLARALAIQPSALLLDEPLSNIDELTKVDVASGLKKLFQKLDIPVLLVTHNHEDAHYLASKVAVMLNGKIEQSGTLDHLLKKPKTQAIQRLLMPFYLGKSAKGTRK